MESLWLEQINLPEFPCLEKDIKTDVLIIGGGFAGILCAQMLEQAGIDYILIEADRICRGISGNTTAKITSQHGLIYSKIEKRYGTEAARMYFQANEDARGRYQSLCEQIPCDYCELDNIVYSTQNRGKLEAEMRTLERIGCPAKFLETIPLPVHTCGGVCFRDQAQFHPMKLIAGIAPRLKIYENTKALSFDGTGIETNRGKIRASAMIVATHFPLFNKHGSYFLKMYQHRSYVLALENAQRLDAMYVDESKKGLSFRGYKDLLLLGGGGHRTGKHGGNWSELKDFAEKNYPNSHIVSQWAAQDCTTLDGIPYIGQYSSKTANMYVATGFNKWGITSSMVASSVLCDLIQGKNNPYADVFSPSRSILHPQLACNALEATMNLLTPTKPRCPHMGCALKWNPQEHSWDCSCHGSRFSDKGELLNNPANDDLNLD